MTETETSPERPHVNRDQVVAAFKQLVERGFTSPALLPLDDPEALIEFSVSRTMLQVEAGFDDPEYLENVANGWLAGDLQDAIRLTRSCHDAARGKPRAALRQIRTRSTFAEIRLAQALS